MNRKQMRFKQINRITEFRASPEKFNKDLKMELDVHKSYCFKFKSYWQ